MIHIDPKETPVKNVHQYLLGGVAPRPIALVSTVSTDGNVNLSPFSFFNAFGANPPIVAFSASRRGRDGTFKDTYNNIMATKECVIQAVTYDMVHQVSLASTEYDTGVDEFVKAGLTPVASDLIKPPRVKESPYHLECRLKEMVSLGEGGAAGNLAICEVVRFHISEDILKDGVIQPDLIDLVGRMGASYYTRASGESIFKVAKPIGKKGIGYDQLPDFIKHSDVLTANNLAQLANVESIPSHDDAGSFVDELRNQKAYGESTRGHYRELFLAAIDEMEEDRTTAIRKIFQAARRALEADNVDFAWRALLYAGSAQKV